jgi:hypothetical protein
VQRTARLVSGLATAALVAGGALAVAPSSDAAAKKITAPIDCPRAYPDSKIAKGLKGTGFSVSSGTKPSPFSATVIGKLQDFPEPGAYVILARIASPAVTAAHGDWAGISGSPVYAADGRLIGSTSYSFGLNSDIVGLTPGSALLPVLNGVPRGAARAVTPRRAHQPLTAAQFQAARAAGVPAAAAQAGLTVSPVALTASGRVTKRFLDLVRAIPGTRYVGVSGAASGAAVKPSALHAGDNFVAAVSYGEASLYGAGTTTLVCKGKAVAFGHPFLDSGAASFTAHTASTVVVQPDSLFGAYKLVNPGGVIGTVDTDVTNGIRATLGTTPKRLTKLTSRFAFGRKVVKGSTTISDLDYAPLAAAIHTETDLAKTFGYEGKGSAKVDIAITGLRGNGKKFSLTRKDVYADPQDLPFVVADTVYGLVGVLAGQEFEDVRLTGINLAGTLSSSVNRYSASSIEAKQGSGWVKVGDVTLSAKPGGTLPLRVNLTPYKGIGAKKTVSLTLTVPASASSPDAFLDVELGARDFDTSSATSFSDILRIIARTPTNDQITASLVDGASGAALSTAVRHVGVALAPRSAGASVDLGTGGGPGGGSIGK